jgi:hypothetical protein
MEEMASPVPTMTAPNTTVGRMPNFCATRPIRMPPMPEPNQASEVASAGTERVPATSAAISVKATDVIQGEPNTRHMMKSAIAATTQDCRVSTEEAGGVGACMFASTGHERPSACSFARQ